MGNAESLGEQSNKPSTLGLACCQQVRLPNIQSIGEDCQQMKLPSMQNVRSQCQQMKLPIVQMLSASATSEELAAEEAAASGLHGPMYGNVDDEYPEPMDAATSSAYSKKVNDEDYFDEDIYGSDNSTEASANHEPDENSSNASQAQHIVQNFVRLFVRGCLLPVLTTNGGEADCVVTLDRQLTTLSVQRANKTGATKHGIPLEQVRKVYVGEDPEQEDNVPKVDSLCVTLQCLPGQAIAFRFLDLEDRDTFVLCISMFADRVKDDMRTGNVGSPRSTGSSDGDSDESSWLGIDFGNEEERPARVHVTPSAPIPRVNF